MKKIIHLSDLHIGYKRRITGVTTLGIFGPIQAKIIEKCQPASDYIIVITGDLLDNVTKKNPYDGIKEILKNFDQAGFKDILIAPGNHDYGTGNFASSKFARQFKKEIYGYENKEFPDFRVIDQVAFIGLDSMQGEVRANQGLWADGEIGKEQRDRLDEILSGKTPPSGPTVKECDYTVVYLHHHPIARENYFKKTFHGLDDAAELEQVCAPYSISALLFGHNHSGKDCNGNWNIKRAYDAGSTTGKKRKRPGPIRIIDLSTPVSSDYDLNER